MHARGEEVLHAGAVRTAEGVVAFVADSGTGKSTLVAALQREGFPSWADDVVYWNLSDQGPRTWHVPSRLRLRSPSAAFFLGIDEVCPPGETQRLRAVCFTSRDAAPAVTRIAVDQALPQLLRAAFYFSLDEAERRRQMLARYLALAGNVPLFACRLPEGLKALAQFVPMLVQTIGFRASDVAA